MFPQLLVDVANVDYLLCYDAQALDSSRKGAFRFRPVLFVVRILAARAQICEHFNLH